jgi:hypothetical protein
MKLYLTAFHENKGAKMLNRIKLLGIILVIIASVMSADKNPAKAAVKTSAAKVNVDTLIVNARLIEIPGTFPGNDLYNYVYIMKYRISAVIKGKYTEKEILVGQYNPLIPRAKIKDKMDQYVDGNVEKFEVGAVHKLTLIRPMDSIWKDAVEDEYFDSDLPKYFALRTDVSAK